MTVALGDVCTFNYGEALKEGNRELGEVPVYGSNGIVGWHDRPITQGPTIVIGRKGSIGEVHYSEVPCYPIDTTYFVDRTRVPCDMIWLYYMLKAIDLTRLNKSAAVPGLNRDDAYREHIPQHSLAEQRRITAILRAADDERRRRRYTQSLSDGLLGEVFARMFGDLEQYQQFPFSELAAKQKGSFVNGPFGSDLLTTELVSTGIPVIYIRDIASGYYQRVSSECVTPEKAIQLDFCRVDSGDVLIAKVGDPPGTAVMYPAGERSGIVTQDVIRLKPQTDIVVPKYLIVFLNSPSGRNRLSPIMVEGTRERFGLTQLKGVLIPLPPLALQHQFVAVADKYEDARRQQQEAARQSEHLFDTLLHQALTAEL